MEHIDGVRYHHVHSRIDRRLLRLLEPLSKWHSVRRPLVASALYHMGYARRVAADLRARNCDFVMLFNFSQYVPVIRKQNPAIKIALNMQCEWLTQFDRTRIERRLRGVDWVIGCSAYIADKVGRRFPGVADRCVPVFNGVDVNRFARRARDGSERLEAGAHLLFVGRVSPEKGLHVLLGALKTVVQRNPNTVLEIVGGHAECPREYIVDLAEEEKVAALARFYNGKSYFSQLQDQLVSAGLKDKVRFSGFLPHSEAAERYLSADVLINPSLSEAFGMSLAEGMASGLPVVATRVGGMPEIVDEGRTGLLVASDDAPALAEAILDMLDDRNRARAMGEAGRERAAELFSWDRIAAQLCELFADGDCR